MNIHGNKVQAGKAVQHERLTPGISHKDNVIVQTDFESIGGGNNKTSRLGNSLSHKSNRLIDARISFYGTYVTLNEQVTLQNQDPVLNECAARLGVSLNILGDNKLNLNILENLMARA